MLTNSPNSALGAQEPRVELIPQSGVDDSMGWDAVDLAAIAGIDLDPWQQRVLVNACRRETSGRWAAFEVGLIANRQNGKTEILKARELAALYLWGRDQLIIHSAHEFKASQEAFLRIRQLIESTPVLEREVEKIRTATGEEGIELKNGSRLRFMARSTGSGRAFSGDLIVLDEAYNLPTKMIAAMLPTMAARSITGNPQIWYASSAGMPNSEALASIRARGVEGADERLAYFEFSAKSWDDMDAAERSAWRDRDAWRSDPKVWAQSNPALGLRIASDFFAAALSSPMSYAEFEREHLGVWEKIGGTTLITPEQWEACRDVESKPTGRVVFAVDVPPARDRASIAVASIRGDGLIHVELVARDNGTGWVADRLAELQQRWQPAAIVLDATSAAGSLVDEVRRRQVWTTPLSLNEYAQGCAQLFDAISQRQLRHLDDPALNSAVDAARMSMKGDTKWVWSRRSTTCDISPLVAITLAAWGLQRAPETTSRRVRVMM